VVKERFGIECIFTLPNENFGEVKNEISGLKEL
jgi:hypothetical protein